MVGKSKKPIQAVEKLESVSTDLAILMKGETEKRKLLTQYISKHMKKDVDYGGIKFGGKESKPSLFKPGSEKYLSLFRFTATFSRDLETWEMAGKIDGLFCYLCLIKNSKGEVVGEGRGAANLKEKAGWTVNNALKIAQKRAQIDAVLRTGGLSDFFTQDLTATDEDTSQYDQSEVGEDAVPSVTYDEAEDMRLDEEGKPDFTAKNTQPTIVIPKDVVEQRKIISALLKKRGVNVKDAKACREYIATELQLSLVENNFPLIINKLS